MEESVAWPSEMTSRFSQDWSVKEATPSATVRKVVNQEAATETPDSRTYICSCSPGTKQPGLGNCH